MNSSVAATLPLTHTSSHHQRVRALFFCSSSHTGASFPSLPTRLSLAGAMHHTHDATRRRDAACRLEAHSPNLVEGEFSECRMQDRAWAPVRWSQVRSRAHSGVPGGVSY